MTTLEWVLLVTTILMFVLLVGALVAMSRWSAMWNMVTYVLDKSEYKDPVDKAWVSTTLTWADEWRKGANPFKT